MAQLYSKFGEQSWFEPVHGRKQIMRVALVFLCLGLAACSGLSRKKETNPQVYGLNDKVPEGGGHYKVGNPYKIAGAWYRPREDRTYDRVGVASWYGDYFHGRLTANGEYYDMNGLSAAHPTLPLPVYARVTNLENNRSLVLRINDRGPYARDRIIDLSKRAANELGVIRKGTAKVRVQYLTDAPLEGNIHNMQALGSGFDRPFNTASIDPPAPTITGGKLSIGWQTTILPAILNFGDKTGAPAITASTAVDIETKGDPVPLQPK
ncbi:MAG: septal ring lytic transglycosylase RlpA family protein [Alphaproteobacteria bacterium]